LPADASTLYAFTSGAGVWKEVDDTGSWTAVNDGLDKSHVSQLATDPSNASIVYASTNGGVFKSSDAGRTWSLTSSGLPTSIIGGIAVDPSQPRTLYSFSQLFGVFKSTDGATSWSAANEGLSIQSVTALAIDPSRPSTLYAGTSQVGTVFKSVDSGESWKATGFKVDIFGVVWLTVDPRDSSTVYAVLNDGYPLKSSDGGITWAQPENWDPLCGGGISLTVDHTNSSILYAGTTEGICKSTDGGKTWRATVISSVLAINQVLISKDDPALLFGAASEDVADLPGGVYWSHDSGQTWQRLDAGMKDTNVACLSFDKTGRVLFAGTTDGGTLSLDLDSLRPPIVNVSRRSSPPTIPPRR
jgi:photosystem II stability/assembly factor-like uncharacterized protein